MRWFSLVIRQEEIPPSCKAAPLDKGLRTRQFGRMGGCLMPSLLVMLWAATLPSKREEVMSHHTAVSQWTEQIARQFAPLRASQAKV